MSLPSFTSIANAARSTKTAPLETRVACGPTANPQATHQYSCCLSVTVTYGHPLWPYLEGNIQTQKLNCPMLAFVKVVKPFSAYTVPFELTESVPYPGIVSFPPGLTVIPFRLSYRI